MILENFGRIFNILEHLIFFFVKSLRFKRFSITEFFMTSFTYVFTNMRLIINLLFLMVEFLPSFITKNNIDNQNSIIMNT